MTLILRIGLVALAIGVLAGVVLRRLVGPRWLLSLAAISAVPWLAHLVYVAVLVQLGTGAAAAVTAFVAVNLLVGGLLWWRLWIGVRRRAVIASFLPVLLALIYSLMLAASFALGLGDTVVVVDNFSYVRLFWATLYMFGMLLAFTMRIPAVRTPRLRLPDLTWLRFKR